MTTPSAPATAWTAPTSARRTHTLWAAWRLHRGGLLSALALLGAAAVVLAISGVAIRNSYRADGLASCGPLAAPQCQAPLDVFFRQWGSWPDLLPTVLLFLPLAIGAFLGAPLVSRDLESGLFRFRWTQGTGRRRQLIVDLSLLAGVLLLACLAFSAFFSWWYSPWLPIRGRMGSTAYDVTGVVFASRAVLAMSLGALVGVVVQRTVAALGVTGFGSAAYALAVAIFLRPHLGGSVTARLDATIRTLHGDKLDYWVTDPTGNRLSSGALDRLDIAAGSDLVRTGQSFHTWLTQHHYVEWISYQPDTQFWAVQGGEALGTLLIAFVLSVATVTLVVRSSRS